MQDTTSWSAWFVTFRLWFIQYVDLLPNVNQRLSYNGGGGGDLRVNDMESKRRPYCGLPVRWGVGMNPGLNSPRALQVT